MSEELKELKSIKKLLILYLLHENVPVEAISKISGITSKTIRNQFPMKKINAKEV